MSISITKNTLYQLNLEGRHNAFSELSVLWRGMVLSKKPRALLLPLDPPEISLLSPLGPAQKAIAKDLGLRIQIIQK